MSHEDVDVSLRSEMEKCANDPHYDFIFARPGAPDMGHGQTVGENFQLNVG